MPAATLTAPQTDLLGQIREHLVLVDAKYGFAQRLARENGWATNFAQRVVDEYAKFLFIAREGGHPVSPPPIIDKAWHLHLVHTEDYWGTFCPNILKMQLHHSPATGTHDESARFADWSGQTLASYGKYFGSPPQIWLSHPRRRRAGPAVKSALTAAAFALAAAVTSIFNGAVTNAAGFFLIGAMVFCFAFVIIFAFQSIARAKGTAANCGSSCGGSDGGSGGSDTSGHSGHGGGHGCSGGHGCGGHGCGGGGGH
jgi:hypothetical protein